jgi:hypothetical protein
MSEAEDNETRIDLLDTLRTMSACYPHLRIGQLIGNALPPKINKDVYYIEDSDLLKYLEKYGETIEHQRAERGE